MSSGRGTSEALRRIGRAGPNASEMELLRAATLDVDRAAAAWRRWSATRSVDDASHRAVNVLPAVSANLPPEVLGVDADRLRGLRRRGWADSQFRLAVIQGAVEVLDPLGIRLLLTKGAALTTTVYIEAGIRPMADVDVVVGAERFDEVMRALTAEGWHRPTLADKPFHNAVELYDSQRRAIDVHQWVLFPRYASAPESEWLERAVPHEVCGSAVLRYRCADEMVLTILNGLLTNESSSVRWPLDVVQAARRGADVDGVTVEEFWDEVVASASAVGAGPIVGDALEMCRIELDAAVPPDAVDRLVGSSLDRHMAQHWALCRRGLTSEWRFRRYRRLHQIDGGRATTGGYAGYRIGAMRSKGLATTVTDRLGRVRKIVVDQLRD